jgi:hypothetical protein
LASYVVTAKEWRTIASLLAEWCATLLHRCITSANKSIVATFNTVSSFYYRTYKKELGGSFTAAAYPLTETGSVIKTTNPNLNK